MRPRRSSLARSYPATRAVARAHARGEQRCQTPISVKASCAGSVPIRPPGNTDGGRGRSRLLALPPGMSQPMNAGIGTCGSIGTKSARFALDRERCLTSSGARGPRTAARRARHIRSGASTPSRSRQVATTACVAAQSARRKLTASDSSTRWWW